jgi:hypothetical protein
MVRSLWSQNLISLYCWIFSFIILWLFSTSSYNSINFLFLSTISFGIDSIANPHYMKFLTILLLGFFSISIISWLCWFSISTTFVLLSVLNDSRMMLNISWSLLATLYASSLISWLFNYCSTPILFSLLYFMKFNNFLHFTFASSSIETWNNLFTLYLFSSLLYSALIIHSLSKPHYNFHVFSFFNHYLYCSSFFEFVGFMYSLKYLWVF